MLISCYCMRSSETFGEFSLRTEMFLAKVYQRQLFKIKELSNPLIYVWDPISLLPSLKTPFCIYSDGEFFCKAAFTKMLTLIGSDMRKLRERKMEPIARQLSLSVRVSRELGVNHKGIGEVSSEILVKRAMDETTDLWKTAPCFESEESLSSFLSLQARH